MVYTMTLRYEVEANNDLALQHALVSLRDAYCEFQGRTETITSGSYSIRCVSPLPIINEEGKS